jgi:NAD(P)-dependent dehydrogenase (short-subunit alcohol dehydrogenase family)
MQNPSVLLVTGASRGIGAATALLAARQGWAVAVNYLGHSLAADEVVRTIRAEGGRAMAVQGDVALEADVLRLFAQVDAKLGPIDRAGEQRWRGGRGMQGRRDECRAPATAMVGQRAGQLCVCA